MAKYSVNYNRSFPEHRSGADFTLYQKHRNSPLTLFKFWKFGFIETITKTLPVYYSWYTFLIFSGVFIYAAFTVNGQEDFIRKRSYATGARWGFWGNRTDLGLYDNIHNRFEKEHGKELKDWAIREN